MILSVRRTRSSRGRGFVGVYRRCVSLYFLQCLGDKQKETKSNVGGCRQITEDEGERASARQYYYLHTRHMCQKLVTELKESHEQINRQLANFICHWIVSSTSWGHLWQGIPLLLLTSLIG